MNLKFTVSGQKLNYIGANQIVADTIKYIGADFVFNTSDWEDLSKWVHFQLDGEDAFEPINLDENDSIPDTYGLDLTEGHWEVWVHGNKLEDSSTVQRITTSTVCFDVISFGGLDGEDPLPSITATVAEQIDGKATRAEKAKITSATATVSNTVGTPAVSVSIGGEDYAHSLDFAFTNLKGMGIASIVFSADGTITVTYDDGTTVTYTGVKEALASMTALENSVEAAEALRVTAETARANAETLRVNAETGRVTAETSRASAETSRVSAETERATAETSRASAETSRTSAETSRVSAETARVSAESERATAETSRASAETSRASAETSRASAETSRASAEASRVTAEASRVTAEASRVTAENAREAAKIVGATATVNSTTGTPAVTVTESEHTGGGKDLNFAFTNLKGESGEGLPSGGTTGQILQKASDDDYDTEWANKPEAQDIFFDCDIRGKLQVTDVQSAIDDLTDLVDELDDDKVDKTTTVNGHALSANVTIADTDIAHGSSTVGATLTSQSSQIVELQSRTNIHLGTDSSGRFCIITE